MGLVFGKDIPNVIEAIRVVVENKKVKIDRREHGRSR